MNKLIRIFVVVITAFTLNSLNAQINMGMVKYEITNVESSDPQMASGLSMMKGSELKVYFSPDNQRVDMDMMGGMMQMTTLHSKDDSNAIVLMKMMGKKMKMTMSPDKLKDMQKDKGAESDNAGMEKPNIQHFEDITKEILGYNCHKVIVTMNNQQGEAQMELYVTNEIVMIKSVAKGTEDMDLGGTALQYSIQVKDMMTMTYEATEVSKTVEKEVFNINTDEYDEVDPSMFGGMIGG